MKKIIKRDGRTVPFEADKIAYAMQKAFIATGEFGLPAAEVEQICKGYAKTVEETLDLAGQDPVGIEKVQDAVEALLMGLHKETAKAYVLYREGRRLGLRPGLRREKQPQERSAPFAAGFLRLVQPDTAPEYSRTFVE